MRKTFALALLAYFLTGCDASMPNQRNPLEPDSETSRATPTDVRFGDGGLTAFESLSPDDKRAAARIIEGLGGQAIGRPRFEIAIAQHSSPDQSIVVIREPGSASRRVVVFSQDNLSDEAFVAAARALSEDEEAHPMVTERRILRVRLEVDATDTRTGSVASPPTPLVLEETQQPMLGKMLATARTTRTEFIDGVGSVRLIEVSTRR